MRNEKINSFWQAVIIGLGTVAAEQFGLWSPGSELKEGESEGMGRGGGRERENGWRELSSRARIIYTHKGVKQKGRWMKTMMDKEWSEEWRPEVWEERLGVERLQRAEGKRKEGKTMKK